MHSRNFGSTGASSIPASFSKNTGIPGNTVAPVRARSFKIARGIRSSLAASGTPRHSSGVIRLLNP